MAPAEEGTAAMVGDLVAGDGTASGDAVVGRIGALARQMRLRGSRVGAGELLTAIRALDHVDGSSREDVRLALSVVLCSEHRDRERFEEAFSAVFGDGRPWEG